MRLITVAILIVVGAPFGCAHRTPPPQYAGNDQANAPTRRDTGSDARSKDAEDYRNDIASLLQKLIQVETTENGQSTFTAPDVEAQQDVQQSLLRMAAETPESRSEVVEALIQVLDDSDAREEYPWAYRWTIAVDVLGELQATEAIETLIRNLDQTGQNGIIISRHYWPVARAIGRIGAVAVPGLIEALSDSNSVIRREAASTLARIGRPAFPGLKEALHHGSATTKGGAALALAWIGGREARVIIERARASEKNPEARKELKDALIEMRRLWGTGNM